MSWSTCTNPNTISRQYNYEKILQMYNDTLQGKARHLGIIMGGTPPLWRIGAAASLAMKRSAAA